MEKCEGKRKCDHDLITNPGDLCKGCVIHNNIRINIEQWTKQYEFVKQNNLPSVLEVFLRNEIQNINSDILDEFNYDRQNDGRDRFKRVAKLLALSAGLKHFSDEFSKLQNSQNTDSPVVPEPSFISETQKKMNGPVKTEGKEIQPVNPYPRIFKDYDCFLFFERLKDMVKERTQLADYSFIYRRMQKDGYIHKGIKDTEFRDFLLLLSIEIERTKSLNACTTYPKETHYMAIKSIFRDL